jgi:hypothetical protein
VTVSRKRICQLRLPGRSETLNRQGKHNERPELPTQATLPALPRGQLHELGYRGVTARSLKPKHIEALLGRWREQELSTGTIKNRMAAIRWWANKVDKRNVVARSNEYYGIPDRRFVTNESKAGAKTQAQLDKVRDEHVRMSLELQQAFGLRREKAMKIRPSVADRGDHLFLQASWTKGGRERIVPIRTEQQREVLNRAHRLAGRSSLIPSNRNYVQQMRVYEGNTRRAGLHHMHGLRHAYAQIRYEELTGWACPATGGPTSRELTREQLERDREVRFTISRELGHERGR